MKAPLCLLTAWIAVGCGGEPAGPRPDLGAGLALVRSEAVQEFYRRASFFYGRLAGRRFDSVVTFRDPELREFFHNEQAFSDYYADLTAALVESHFERNRPLLADVEEFVVEGPGRARVRVRIVGESGLPLRWWSTSLVREDRWERARDRWWIVPGHL